MSNKHTKITRIKQKYSNDNQKARRKIIELQPQNFIYSFQVKLNKTTYLSFKHIICRFMIESDNVADNLVFAVNSLITLYQIRHFYLLAKWRPRCARRHARPHWHQRSDRSGTSVIIPILCIALLAFGFPLTTCHILLYSRIIFKIEIIFLFLK